LLELLLHFELSVPKTKRQTRFQALGLAGLGAYKYLSESVNTFIGRERMMTMMGAAPI
jgi:hypothetical protein